MRCPKCGSTNVETERRPDGDSICIDCNYKAPSKEFTSDSEAKPFEFQDGDIAEFCGLVGVVKIDIDNSDYPVFLKFDGGGESGFTLNGRRNMTHTKPLLVLIERPKKKRKEKKTIERWVNIHPNVLMPGLAYLTEVDAHNSAYPNRIACVKLTGEYEVEEEV